MKVLSYNISWFKQEKVDWALAHTDVDAFVLPECANESKTNIPNGYSFYWMGNYDNKGLGVIVNNKRKHIIPSWYNKTLSYAIPILIEDDVVSSNQKYRLSAAYCPVICWELKLHYSRQ